MLVENFGGEVDMEDLADDKVGGTGAGCERQVMQQAAFEAGRRLEDSRGGDGERWGGLETCKFEF